MSKRYSGSGIEKSFFWFKVLAVVLSVAGLVLMLLPTMRITWMAETSANSLHQNVSWISPYLVGAGNSLPSFAFAGAGLSLILLVLGLSSKSLFAASGYVLIVSAVIAFVGRSLSNSFFYVPSIIPPVLLLLAAVCAFVSLHKSNKSF